MLPKLDEKEGKSENERNIESFSLNRILEAQASIPTKTLKSKNISSHDLLSRIYVDTNCLLVSTYIQDRRQLVSTYIQDRRQLVDTYIQDRRQLVDTYIQDRR